jgi:hypothetical protein
LFKNVVNQSPLEFYLFLYGCLRLRSSTKMNAAL